MSAIKVILVLATLAVLGWGFRNRQRVGIRAGTRVLAVLVALFAVVAIIDPGITQEFANLVGVTRGTDLVLYTLVVAFAVTSLGLYFRFREYERRFAVVVRSLAIREAVMVSGLPGAEMETPIKERAGADKPQDAAREGPEAARRADEQS